MNAWRGPAASGGIATTTLVLVGGYTGSSKTEFARFLGDVFGLAFLDKGLLTPRLAERCFTSLDGDSFVRFIAVQITVSGGLPT
ncbi:hypothetical protein [Actinomadura coerulea]|uniref:hypothetical protein n=1 Tax=Actinomadura coerulea TaxID=46159 RepID=UPI003429BE13